MDNSKHRKLVPADDASVWTFTHLEDVITDNIWEEWQVEQKKLLDRILKQRTVSPVPFNRVAGGKHG